MKALRVTISLLLIPRLFLSLVLFPILFGLSLVLLGLLVSTLALNRVGADSVTLQARAGQVSENGLARKLLYGSSAELGPIQICRWTYQKDERGQLVEMPPSQLCQPDRLDIALQVNDPARYDPRPYQLMFNSKVPRLHLCKECHPDIIIKPEGGEVQTEIASVWGFLVLSLLSLNDELRMQYIETTKKLDTIKGRLGVIFYHHEGLRDDVRINSAGTSIAIIFNLAFITLLSVWLALKAHRKVLDYFARSGALLPLVAQVGRSNFYAAIWILTLVRVAGFLLGVIPAAYLWLTQAVRSNQLENFMGKDSGEIALWLVALVSSFALAMVLASVAELQHRHSILSFTYKYIPLLVCSAGAAIWGVTFLFDGALSGSVRNVLSALPVVGMAPVLVAPLFKPALDILVLNTLFSFSLITISLKYNARWLAAHLEEV